MPELVRIYRNTHVAEQATVEKELGLQPEEPKVKSRACYRVALSFSL